VVPKQEIAHSLRACVGCDLRCLRSSVPQSLSSSARSIGLGFSGEMGGSRLLVGTVISFARIRASTVRAMQSGGGGQLGLAAMMATLLL
jgi:hypothetical protein